MLPKEELPIYNFLCRDSSMYLLVGSARIPSSTTKAHLTYALLTFSLFAARAGCPPGDKNSTFNAGVV
jgi:hypothetical protein